MIKQFTFVGRILLLAGVVWLGYSIILLATPGMEIRFNGELTNSLGVKLLVFGAGVLYVLFASVFAFVPHLLLNRVKKSMGVHNDTPKEAGARTRPEEPLSGITDTTPDRDHKIKKTFWKVGLPFLLLWALVLIVVPKYDLMDAQILKKVFQGVMMTGLVLFGISALYTVVKMIYALGKYALGDRDQHTNIFTTPIQGLRPVQIFTYNLLLFLIAFFGVGIAASYLGTLLR